MLASRARSPQAAGALAYVQSYGWAAGIEKPRSVRAVPRISPLLSVRSWTRALIAAGPSTGHGQLNGR